MWKFIKPVLASKKAVAVFVAILVWVGGKFGLALDAAELFSAVSPLLAYIVGQGIADNGKEAVKLKTPPPLPPPPE